MSSKKISMTLNYSCSGAQPPIFLAGSFSEPAWHPQEMEFTTDENGELHFHKEIEVVEGGTYQYKFRIGLGDWWALNEQAPTVTDELGNRNNLLAVPTTNEIIKTSKSLESTTAAPASDRPVPELVVEKVDGEPRHGDDFGANATTGQKDAHDMRALDTEPDQVVIRSLTTTPTYAKTAAEVAESAAMLDREPSPAPVSDEEAGRTGERRMSGTPIPLVALTAAEVADIAAIIDQDDEGGPDDMAMSLPEIHYTYDTPSGSTTPWHERAPLFAHELVGSREEESESPITSESLESPSKPEHEEEVVDLNDPTLERFPEDRMSILTHIRSCESRMSEDETNVQGVPPSPIAKSKSRSPSIDTPTSARLDAQPSPALDVITEEYQEEDSYFSGLPGPVQKFQGAEEVRPPDELKVIHETEEPAEDPKSVLDKLKKIEESTADSENNIVKESVKRAVDENMAIEGAGIAKEHIMIDSTKENLGDHAETFESLSPEADGKAEKSHPGPTGIEVQTETQDMVVGKNRHSDIDAESSPEELSDTSPHVSDPLFQVQGQKEQNEDEVSGKGGQSNPKDGPVPEVQNEQMENFNEHEEVHEGQTEVENRHEPEQNRELLQDEQAEDQQKLASRMQNDFMQPLDSRVLHSEGKFPDDENPDNSLKADILAYGNVVLEKHDDHLQSVEAVHVVQKSQESAGPSEISKSQEHGQSQLDHVNNISIGGVITKDEPAESTIEARDAEKASTAPDLSTEQEVLETAGHKSTVTLESPHKKLVPADGTVLPVVQPKFDEVSLNTEHDMLGSESQIGNASGGLEKSALLGSPHPVAEVTHEADLPDFQAKPDKAPLAPEHEVPGTEILKSAISVEQSLADVEAIYKPNLHVSQMKVDEQVSDVSVKQLLNSEGDKSASLQNTQPQVGAIREADLPVMQLSLEDAILASHVKPGVSTTNDVDEGGLTVTSNVDNTKSTSVEAPSQNGNNKTTNLALRKTATPNTERPVTPSSIRSPLKASEPNQSIWRTVFGDWLGGLLASLCGGDRGPLLVISAMVILGPLLALYFYQLDVL